MSNTPYREYISKLETLYDTVVESKDDGYYEGERNSEGQPHGFGTMHYPKNDKNKREKYSGQWVKGKIHGKGKLLWSNGNTYDGEWDGDLINGKGKFVGTDGSSYEGEWKNGKKHGKGKQKWKNDNTYEGEWDGDLINGKGKFVGTDGSSYEGEWKNGKKHGKGIMIVKDVLSYEEEWREDKLINIIVIDLNDIFTDIYYIERIRNVYRNLNIPIPTSKEALPINLDDTYEMGLRYLKYCMAVDKIWLDPTNGFIIAYHRDGRGYSFSEKYFDSFLNKKSKYGIDSLTEHEKMFLEQSKYKTWPI